jgi:hypothetical protein
MTIVSKTTLEVLQQSPLDLMHNLLLMKDCKLESQPRRYPLFYSHITVVSNVFVGGLIKNPTWMRSQILTIKRILLSRPTVP